MTGPARRYDLDDLAGHLFDLLSNNPDGLSVGKIAARLGIPPHAAVAVIRHLRLTLAVGDSINVPWRTEGKARIYFLAGQQVDGQVWQVARMRARLSNFDVDLAWWRSMVAGSDETTPAGRLARRILRHFEGVAADVREIQEEIQQ